MGKKRKHESNENEYEFDPSPKHLQVSHVRDQEKRLIVILEGAQLESVKVRQSIEMNVSDEYVKKYVAKWEKSW